MNSGVRNQEFPMNYVEFPMNYMNYLENVNCGIQISLAVHSPGRTSGELSCTKSRITNELGEFPIIYVESQVNYL